MFMIWDSRQQDWQLFWLSFEHCSLPTDFYKKYDYTIVYHICGNKMVQVVEIHPQEMREPDFLQGQ